MKEEYVTYEQAVKLKELGFDERTTYEYSEIVEGSGREEWDEDEQRMMFIEDIIYYPKLRLDQAQKYLREAKEIDIDITLYRSIDMTCNPHEIKRSYEIRLITGEDYPLDGGVKFPTYELALSAGIDAAIEYLTANGYTLNTK